MANEEYPFAFTQGIYTHRLSSFGGVALRDSLSVTYKNTLLELTTWAPTRILEIRRVLVLKKSVYVGSLVIAWFLLVG